MKEHLPYERQNEQALGRFKETYPNIQQAFERYATDAISYLRLLGFGCAACGKNKITISILNFFGYSPRSLCYDCQKSRKLFTK